MSCPQIWNIEQEKDRENEKVGDRLEKLNEKKSDKELDREIKKKIRRRISLEEQNENFIPAVRKWELLAAFKVKMSDSEMKKANRNTSYKMFCKHNDVFSIERCYLEVSRCNDNDKEMYKKVCCTCKVVFLFLLVGPINFFLPLSLPSPIYTILFLVWVHNKFINESFAFSPGKIHRY